MRRRPMALLAAAALAVGACANSPGTTDQSGGSPSGTRGPTGTVDPAQLTKNVPIDAPGVTDREIRVGGVVSKSNPLSGEYDQAAKGVEAYFAMMNAKGGLYGRQLTLGKVRDDQVTANQAEVQALIAEDDVFAVMPVAVLLFTGAQLLADEKVPTFGWNINPEFAGPPNLFGEKGSYLCFTCAEPTRPWLAKQVGAKKVGILAYGISDQSKDCGKGVEASFTKYPVASVAFRDLEVPFGTTDFSVQVQKMKDAGVDFIVTCMDTNGVTTLAKEIKKQELRATQYLQNGYDFDMLSKFSDLFQGSIVLAGFSPFEFTPAPPGLQEYFTWIDKVGGKRSEVSLAGWLDADLFVQGLIAAGPEFDRQKLIDAINQMTDWDGNGILAGVDWTIAHDKPNANDCNAFVKVEGNKFVPQFTEPGKPFVCIPTNVTQIPDKPDHKA